MRKVIMCSLAFLMVASIVSAEAFAPVKMTISAPAYLGYAFDGSNLSVNFTSSLKGSYYFLVFTQGKGSSVANAINGLNGTYWHQVCGIDTCVFFSTQQPMNEVNTYVWDGKGVDEYNATPAGLVSPDIYTYYIWGVDTFNARQMALQRTALFSGSGAASFSMQQNYRTFVTKDSAGVDLAQPILYMGDGARSGSATTATSHVNFKWIIGNDPIDNTFRETCRVTQRWDTGAIYINPSTPGIFYKPAQIHSEDTGNQGGVEVRKYTWRANGVGTMDDATWGNAGYSAGAYFYATSHLPKWYMGDLDSDGSTLWTIDADEFSKTPTTSKIYGLDLADGSKIQEIDLAAWWVNSSSYDALGSNTGGPFSLEYHANDGFLALGSHTTCINQVINPSAEGDAIFVWTNRNGDYIGDKNMEVGALHPGVCNDNAVATFKYHMSRDYNGFAVFPCYDRSDTFGLYAPDGTGLGYVALASETNAMKVFSEFIDYGSTYDGLYVSDIGSGQTANWSFMYVGQECFQGTIGDSISVKQAAPVAFTVSQNSPNPFNPTTTITFKLAKAGKTTVDVFNAAGQKVDTIVNGTMSAGSHSVTWNAAKFSAGVYFYTVKSGSFSKTMKMTLLK